MRRRASVPAPSTNGLSQFLREAVEEEAREVADIGVAVGEGDAVAGDHPDHRDQAADGEGLHQGRKDVLLAHHAAIEQREARDGHHQHERGAAQHPGGVAGVDLRRRGAAAAAAGASARGRAPRASITQAAARRGLPCPAERRCLFMVSVSLADRHSASASISPVRMRMARSMSMTKILPSPILPVCADLVIASTTGVGEVVGHRDLDLHLGQEADVVFGAPVDLRLALLAAEALDLGDRQALHAKRRECFAHVVELERLDDGHDQFHGGAPCSLTCRPPPRRRLPGRFQEPCREAAWATICKARSARSAVQNAIGRGRHEDAIIKFRPHRQSERRRAAQDEQTRRRLLERRGLGASEEAADQTE